jgi:NNP family nitrate/nitrite transporter-like MFS transporter
VLGFFMSLGKAAVFKHIPVYYPNNVGAVGGLVGMIGGLGGFVLPIAFGVLNDLTGIWTSCFMLLFLIVAGSLPGCTSPIRRWSGGAARRWRSCRTCRNAAHPRAEGRAMRRAALIRLAAGGPAFWEDKGRDRARNLWISIPALLLAFAVWMVWSVVVAKLPRRLRLHHRPAVLAGGAARPVGRDAAHLLLSFMVPIFGGGCGRRCRPGR